MTVEHARPFAAVDRLLQRSEVGKFGAIVNGDGLEDFSEVPAKPSFELIDEPHDRRRLIYTRPQTR